MYPHAECVRAVLMAENRSCRASALERNVAFVTPGPKDKLAQDLVFMYLRPCVLPTVFFSQSGGGSRVLSSFSAKTENRPLLSRRNSPVSRYTTYLVSSYHNSLDIPTRCSLLRNDTVVAFLGIEPSELHSSAKPWALLKRRPAATLCSSSLGLVGCILYLQQEA